MNNHDRRRGEKKNDIQKVKFGIEEDKRINEKFKIGMEAMERYKKLLGSETQQEILNEDERQQEISGIEDFFNELPDY